MENPSPADSTVVEKTANTELLKRLLEVMEEEILPLTEQEVDKGNKIFGAALLRKCDNSTYLVATNNEMQSPLHHGEMHLLKHYFDIEPNRREPASELIFFSTHEPCSMCLSAITWSGFDNFYYLFSHEDSRDEFEIPHDLKILNEVFGLAPGGYKKDNGFWHSHSVSDLLEQAVDEIAAAASDSGSDTDNVGVNISVLRAAVEQARNTIARIRTRYREMSQRYQASKAVNAIPLK